MAHFFPLFCKFEPPKQNVSPFENKLRKTEKTSRYKFKRSKLRKQTNIKSVCVSTIRDAVPSKGPDDVEKKEAERKLQELKQRRNDAESEELEKMKQKQQDAEVELEELKKKREERRRIMEEEERQKKQELEEKKAREMVRLTPSTCSRLDFRPL